MTEKHTIERTYYYFSDTDLGIYPDHESMIAFLLDENILFAGNSYESGTINLYININDYFVPGSDAEKLPLKDVAKFFDMYRKDGYDGITQYVADKRGIENKHWRNK